mmetsp:Transcript_17333/g.27648  ORF Transcript_17333/g.27648 Transcript_17333/m.27648 type:complete len:96 (-) Transcript_17333:211-498(-)
MVKSKNHTNRNASFKAMRNGIKKPKCWRMKVKSLKYRGMKGMDPQFRRNQRYARLGMKRAALRKRQSLKDGPSKKKVAKEDASKKDASKKAAVKK